MKSKKINDTKNFFIYKGLGTLFLILAFLSASSGIGLALGFYSDWIVFSLWGLAIIFYILSSYFNFIFKQRKKKLSLH